MSVRRTVLHDPYLVGNGGWCSCCFPNGRPSPVEWAAFLDRQNRWGCNECAGGGRIAFTAEEVVARTIAERRPQRAGRRPTA